MPGRRRCCQRLGEESKPGPRPEHATGGPGGASHRLGRLVRRIIRAMRLAHGFLVIVDISGYTAFINERETSLLHAEQIITELMESVIDRATHPLLVNKLEGDAALMYGEVTAGDREGARDVLAQVKAFFPAFAGCLGRQREARANCTCDACKGIERLQLKAFVHLGEFAVKRVLHFEELAGEEVILVHRLLKNHVPLREYVLMTEPARAAAELDPGLLKAHSEDLDGIGATQLWLTTAQALPFDLPPAPLAAAPPPPPAAPAPARGLGQRLRAWLGGA
jgi:hypothetical protein